MSKYVTALLFIALVLFPSELSGQCAFSCPTADDVAFQAILDAGGDVTMEGRVYNTCNIFVMPSNTHVHGTRGATIIRGSALSLGRTVNGLFINSTIGGVGVNNVSVSDLTIDHFTCARNANGISFLPTGIAGPTAFDGQPSSNVVVENVEVQMTPGNHNYAIWSMRGQHVKFINNFVDGNSMASGAQQEGLEAYGGVDVVMTGNTVRNMGNACIILGSAGFANTDTFGLTIADNILENCNIGIGLGTSNDSFGLHNVYSTKLVNNTISRARAIGIDIPAAPETVISDLLISGNTIRDMAGPSPRGIRIWTTAGATLPSNNVTNNTIADNHIENLTGTIGLGIYINQYPNVRLINNYITNTSSESMFIRNAQDIDIIGNRIERAGGPAIGLYKQSGGTLARIAVERNRFVDWPSWTSAVLALGVARGTMKDNTFGRTDAAPATPITLASGACGVTTTGNVPWHLVSYTQPTTPACP